MVLGDHKADKNVGIFFESKSEQSVREHNDGQKAGSQASWVDKLATRMVGTGSEHGDKGFENGIAYPADDYDDDDDD